MVTKFVVMYKNKAYLLITYLLSRTTPDVVFSVPSLALLSLHKSNLQVRVQTREYGIGSSGMNFTKVAEIFQMLKVKNQLDATKYAVL
jgi:hypothetical protein